MHNATIVAHLICHGLYKAQNPLFIYLQNCKTYMKET